MELKDILNADLGEVGQWIGRGFTWWVDELRSLVPVRLREGLSRQPRYEAEYDPSASIWRYWRDGRLVELAAAPRGSAARVGLVLTEGAALSREIDYPLLPLGDLKRMIGLDVDRLTPFRADEVLTDVEVVRRDAGAGRQTASLGVLPKGSAVEALDRARSQGLEPIALRARTPDGEVRYDFLPAFLASEGASPSGRRLLYWQAAVVGLLLINILALVFRDVSDVNALDQAVQAQQATANIALRLRQNIERENARRQALLERRARTEPLRILSAVTKALPAGVFVQRLEWNGQSIRLAGMKSITFDVPAAIRGSSAFTNPRTLAMDAQTRTGTGEPFDVVADAEKRPGS
jgi:general secretion pathway protein L